MKKANKSKDRKKPCCIYVPENFDPEVLPAELRRHADSARYFLHRIIWGQMSKRRTIDNHVPLKFDYLREVIPNRIILPLKKALIEAEVIKCDGYFIEGRKSLGYRLGVEYRKARIIRVAVGHKATAKKVRANRQSTYKKINYRKQGNKTFGYVTFAKNSTNQYRGIDKIIEDTVSFFNPVQKSIITPSTSTAYTPSTASRKETQNITGKAFKTTETLPRDISVNRDFLTPDEQHFVTLCEQGKLYRTLKEEMEEQEMPLLHRVKTELFKVLFGSNHLKSRMKDVFKELFPSVAEVIRVHKTKDYRFLPRLLQNIEANFIINGVCRRLMVEMQDAPVYTIHDSVLTTRPFVEPIRQIMIEEFARLGLTPTLHEKDYGTLKAKALRGP